MRLIRHVVGAVAVAAVAGIAAWYVWRPAAVSAVAPSRGDAAEVVYASGVVEPRNWAKVAPVVRERIIEQCDCEGSRVAKGDVLARLDDTEVRALLAEIDARLDLAQEVYRRLSVLAEKNAASRQAVDEAQSELSRIPGPEGQPASQAGELRAALAERRHGAAPGRRGRRDRRAGHGAVLGRPAEAADRVADVNEEDIPRVEVGQRALVRPTPFPGGRSRPRSTASRRRAIR